MQAGAVALPLGFQKPQEAVSMCLTLWQGKDRSSANLGTSLLEGMTLLLSPSTQTIELTASGTDKHSGWVSLKKVMSLLPQITGANLDVPPSVASPSSLPLPLVAFPAVLFFWLFLAKRKKKGGVKIP